MSLAKLRIKNIRNISSAEVTPFNGINIIYGNNGSGKTSLLEAINILATGKSFRSNHIKSVIAHNQTQLVVFAQIQNNSNIIRAGIERQVGQKRIRLNEQNLTSIAELAQLLPVQYLGPESHQILELGPRFRRQLMDWGVFHVEHGYYSHWLRFHKYLKQRNTALKNKRYYGTLSSWDKELANTAHQVDNSRKEYLAGLIPIFNDYLAILSDGLAVYCTYQRGWQEDTDYMEVLKKSLQRDQQRGFTHYGPHRADLCFRTNELQAKEELSRGQQKMVVNAFRLAQVSHLSENTSRKCIILVDDLSSELDAEHKERMIALLEGFETQIFITCVEPSILETSKNKKMFHVEHGMIKEVL